MHAAVHMSQSRDGTRMEEVAFMPFHTHCGVGGGGVGNLILF